MTAGWLILALACCGPFVWGCRWAGGEGAERFGAPFSALLAAGLAVRVALAWTTQGYGADIATFSAWAGHAAEVGLGSFYSPGYFADYPPGYIYVLWCIGKLRAILGLDFGSPGFLLLLKLPAILADGGIAWLVWRLAGRSAGPAAALALLWLFNPAALLDSAVWGQVDAVLAVFIILGIMLLEESPGLAGVSFAAALLVKPQALIFAPLPLLFFADRLLRSRDRRSLADLLVYAGAGVAFFALAILPFATGREPAWIVGKYFGTLASYPYATLNAFNLYALAGGNGAATAERLLFLPYSAWGTLFIAAIVVFAAAVGLRGCKPDRWWYLALFLAAAVFVLSAKMHERYLFPALPAALALYAASRDRTALWLYAGFSITHFLNMAEVLALGHREIYLVPPLAPLLLAVSLANIALLVLLVRLGYRRYLHIPSPTGRGCPKGG